MGRTPTSTGSCGRWPAPLAHLAHRQHAPGGDPGRGQHRPGRPGGLRAARVHPRGPGGAKPAARSGRPAPWPWRWGSTANGSASQRPGSGLRGYEAVISTLPAHAADALAAPLGLEVAKSPGSIAPGALAPGAVLLDVAYDPWPSALANAWEAAGGVVVSGLAMLVHQGVEQVKLFSGVQRCRLGPRHKCDVRRSGAAPALIDAAQYMAGWRACCVG